MPNYSEIVSAFDVLKEIADWADRGRTRSHVALSARKASHRKIGTRKRISVSSPVKTWSRYGTALKPPPPISKAHCASCNARRMPMRDRDEFFAFFDPRYPLDQPHQAVARKLQNSSELTKWESDFCFSLKHRNTRLTSKQAAILKRIAEKVLGYCPDLGRMAND
jgi:hypothetical protein